MHATREPDARRPARPLRLRVLRAGLGIGLAAAAGGFLTTRWLVREAERAYPPLGASVVVDGLRQQVLERGAGPALVLVHGAFGGSHDFAATVLPELATRYHCVLWDRPGHGYSERPDGVVDPGVQGGLLLDLVRALELDRPLLVGFSYGGAVVLAAALREPEAVRGVVLLNGPSHPWPDPIEFHYELPTVPLIGPLLVETLLTPFARLTASASTARAFAPQAVPEAFAASPVALALRPATYRANAEDIRTLKPFLRAQSARYGELRTPLTLVVSQDDLVVSPTIHAPALHAAAPHSRLVPVPGAGHQILYTHPAVVVAAIDAAIDEMRRPR